MSSYNSIPHSVISYPACCSQPVTLTRYSSTATPVAHKASVAFRSLVTHRRCHSFPCAHGYRGRSCHAAANPSEDVVEGTWPVTPIVCSPRYGTSAIVHTNTSLPTTCVACSPHDIFESPSLLSSYDLQGYIRQCTDVLTLLDTTRTVADAYTGASLGGPTRWKSCDEDSDHTKRKQRMMAKSFERQDGRWECGDGRRRRQRGGDSRAVTFEGDARRHDMPVRPPPSPYDKPTSLNGRQASITPHALRCLRHEMEVRMRQWQRLVTWEGWYMGGEQHTKREHHGRRFMDVKSCYTAVTQLLDDLYESEEFAGDTGGMQKRPFLSVKLANAIASLHRAEDILLGQLLNSVALTMTRFYDPAYPCTQ